MTINTTKKILKNKNFSKNFSKKKSYQKKNPVLTGFFFGRMAISVISRKSGDFGLLALKPLNTSVRRALEEDLKRAKHNKFFLIFRFFKNRSKIPNKAILVILRKRGDHGSLALNH